MESKMIELKTRESYGTKKAPVTWSVITKKGIVMTANFLSKEDAINFRDNAYYSYYKNCEVKCIKARY